MEKKKYICAKCGRPADRPAKVRAKVSSGDENTADPRHDFCSTKCAGEWMIEKAE